MSARLEYQCTVSTFRFAVDAAGINSPIYAEDNIYFLNIKQKRREFNDKHPG